MNLSKSNLTAENLKEAELEIIWCCQLKKFTEEIAALQKGESVKKSSHIFKLNPVLQDEVLRVGGRLGKRAMLEDTKYPAILPKDHHVTDLIPQDIHQKVGHSGCNYMLSQLRLKY